MLIYDVPWSRGVERNTERPFRNFPVWSWTLDSHSTLRWWKKNERHTKYGDVTMIRLLANIGRLQFIMKQMEGDDSCLCNYHLDTVFFRSFEHCTKWRLEIFDSFYIARYMKSEDNGIVCLRTALVDSKNDNKRRRGLMSKEDSERAKLFYPLKHHDNIKNTHPPSLFQQSLHTVLKSKV